MTWLPPAVDTRPGQGHAGGTRAIDATTGERRGPARGHMAGPQPAACGQRPPASGGEPSANAARSATLEKGFSAAC